MRLQTLVQAVVLTVLFLTFSSQPARAYIDSKEGQSEESQRNTFEILTTNFRVGPLGIIFGNLNASVEFKISERMTVGPVLHYYTSNLMTNELGGMGIGARANICLTSGALMDSWFIGPVVGFSQFTVTQGELSGKANGFHFGSAFGYQWFWETGFNMNLGAGLAWYDLNPRVPTENGKGTLELPTYSGLVPHGEFTLGWAF